MTTLLTLHRAVVQPGWVDYNNHLNDGYYTVIFSDATTALMAYIGLVPSEHSSGDSVRRGGITKAGNGQARRALIEGAWTYRMQARVSRKLYDRLEELPQGIRDTAWKAQVRLCARYRRLVAKGKPKVVVTAAIAREMIGFIWAIARQVPLQAV